MTSPRLSILWGLVVVLGCEVGPSSVENPDTSGPLELAFDAGEVAVAIYVNGSRITDAQLASQLNVRAVDLDDEYVGNQNNKTVTKNPSGLDRIADVEACEQGMACGEGNSFFQDDWITSGSRGGNIAEVVGGDYRIELRDEDSVISDVIIAMNHPNAGGNNGTFLDISNDQTIEFFINSSLQETDDPNVKDAHTRASTNLSVSFTQPSEGAFFSVGENITFGASTSDGLSGTKKVAWDWSASGGKTETFDTEFSTSMTTTKSFSTTGQKKIRVIARDGNDSGSTSPRGGQYAMSSSARTVNIEHGDATEEGNTIPSNATTNTFYAVSVTMKNTGNVPWDPALGYKLGQDANGTWIPYPAVSFTGSVAVNATKTFNFNLKHIEFEELGNNACDWQMQQDGVGFGEVNTKNVFVSGGGSSFEQGLMERLFAWLTPREVHADVASARIYQDGEIVQVLTDNQHKIDAKDVEALGKYVLRYEASLADSWNVDFYFRVKYDENVFSVGAPVKGDRGQGHEVEVTKIAPGEVLIRADRKNAGGISGKGLILEVPFNLIEGKKSPESLPLVELVTTK